MNIPVILYGDDGSLLNRIESQRGRVSVACRTSAKPSAWRTQASPVYCFAPTCLPK